MHMQEKTTENPLKIVIFLAFNLQTFTGNIFFT